MTDKIRQALKDVTSVEYQEGLHSKIDMDIEDIIKRELSLEESKLIGKAIRMTIAALQTDAGKEEEPLNCRCGSKAIVAQRQTSECWAQVYCEKFCGWVGGDQPYPSEWQAIAGWNKAVRELRATPPQDVAPKYKKCTCEPGSPWCVSGNVCLICNPPVASTEEDDG